MGDNDGEYRQFSSRLTPEHILFPQQQQKDLTPTKDLKTRPQIKGKTPAPHCSNETISARKHFISHQSQPVDSQNKSFHSAHDLTSRPVPVSCRRPPASERREGRDPTRKRIVTQVAGAGFRREIRSSIRAVLWDQSRKAGQGRAGQGRAIAIDALRSRSLLADA